MACLKSKKLWEENRALFSSTYLRLENSGWSRIPIPSENHFQGASHGFGVRPPLPSAFLTRILLLPIILLFRFFIAAFASPGFGISMKAKPLDLPLSRSSTTLHNIGRHQILGIELLAHLLWLADRGYVLLISYLFQLEFIYKNKLGTSGMVIRRTRHKTIVVFLALLGPFSFFLVPDRFLLQADWWSYCRQGDARFSHAFVVHPFHSVQP